MYPTPPLNKGWALAASLCSGFQGNRLINPVSAIPWGGVDVYSAVVSFTYTQIWMFVDVIYFFKNGASIKCSDC